MQELTQHYEQKKKLENEEKMLMSLEGTSGTPRAPGYDLGAEVTGIKEYLCSLRSEIKRDEERVAAFIDTIEVPYIRTIFKLRFIHCLTWREVAAAIGNRNTSDGVRMACYRYLDKRSRQE